MEKNERLAWRTKPRTHIAGAPPAAQSVIAMGDPSNCKFQKKTFQSLKSCFLIFPSRHPWEQAVSFSGAFPAAQSAIAMGDPSDWQISKENFSELWKVVFWISPPDTLESRQWAFQVLFQLPKAQLQWETLPTGKFQRTIFQSLKSCFLIFPSDTLESRQWAFQVLFQLPKAQLQWETLPESPPPVTCLNPPGPTRTERTPNLDGTRRGNKFRI